jgi:hypothetical protein
MSIAQIAPRASFFRVSSGLLRFETFAPRKRAIAKQIRRAATSGDTMSFIIRF